MDETKDQNKATDRSNDGSACDISRRHLLQLTVRGGIVFITGTLGREAAGATWEQVGKAESFVIGTPKLVKLSGSRPVFVLRQAKDRWLALSARCTHDGGELRWESGAKQFVCLWHGATFSPTGQVRRGPARTPLAPLPMQVQGGVARVDGSQKSASPRPRKHREGDDDDDEHREGEREHSRGRKRDEER